MDRLKRTCALMAVLVVFLVALSCKKTEERTARESGKASDFSLTDLQGAAVTLSQMRGQVVLVEFWATWCPPCSESVPELNKVYEKFKDRNFRLLGISVDKGGDVVSRVRAFVKEHAIGYPVMVDDGSVHVSYGVSSIPVMFVVDKDGRVVKRHMGFIPGLAEILSKEVEDLL